MRRSLTIRAASAVSSTHSIEGGRTIDRLHIRGTAKRRGDHLPARLRFSAHRGVTLVELMISMLILTIVCVAWLEIIGIQSAKKEARRREAVDRLSGMMDAFCYLKGSGQPVAYGSYYITNSFNNLVVNGGDATLVYPMFRDEVSPIGYQLRVVRKRDLPDADGFEGWSTGSRWLVGQLYSQNGITNDVGNPFFTLSVCLGAN